MRWTVPSSTVGFGDCDIASLGAGAARGASALSSRWASAGVAMSTASSTVIKAFCMGSPSRSMTQTAWIWRYLDGQIVPTPPPAIPLGPLIGRASIYGLSSRIRRDTRSSLRLWLEAPGLGSRPRLAGWRNGRSARHCRLDDRLSRRPFARQQILDLVAGERLKFKQPLGKRLEISPPVIEDALGFVIAGFDKPFDLGVDLAAGFLRDVLLARHLVAQEDFILVLPIGDGTKLLGQSPTRHHHAGELGRLLDVGGSTGSDLLLSEHELLGHA